MCENQNRRLPIRAIILLSFIMVMFAAGGCVPTVSLHSYRDVAVTITHAESGEPVAHEPFRVLYTYAPADSPLVYHVEMRTPDEVVATTDAQGKAVVKLADYAWEILLYMNEDVEGGHYTFFLSKDVIRNGGQAEPFHDAPMKVQLCPVASPKSS